MPFDPSYAEPGFYSQPYSLPAATPPKLSGGNMPIIGAGITAGGTVGGAVVGGKAQKQAAEIQAKSAANTLAFAKDQEAYKRQSYEQAMEAYRQQYNAAQARRDALLASYGFDVPSGGSLSLSAPLARASTQAPTDPNRAQIERLAQGKGMWGEVGRGLLAKYDAQYPQAAPMPQSGYTAQQPAVASGGIRSLMSAAPEAQRANVGSLDDVYLAPWGNGNWSE